MLTNLRRLLKQKVMQEMRGKAFEDGLIYGNITLKRYPNHSVRAWNGNYGFEYKRYTILNTLACKNEGGLFWMIDIKSKKPIGPIDSATFYKYRGSILF